MRSDSDDAVADMLTIDAWRWQPLRVRLAVRMTKDDDHHLQRNMTDVERIFRCLVPFVGRNDTCYGASLFTSAPSDEFQSRQESGSFDPTGRRGT